jgi:hypothetical protein
MDLKLPLIGKIHWPSLLLGGGVVLVLAILL